MNKFYITAFIFALSFAVKAQLHIATDTLNFNNNTNTQVKLLASDSLSSTFFITIPVEVKLHFHANHTENVYVIEGKGIMKLGKAEFKIKKGDWIIIPKNITHSVISKGRRPLKVISVQSPFFDGKDRVMVDN